MAIPITYEESLTRPENRFDEVVKGELRRRSPSARWHNYLIENLADELKRQLSRDSHRVLIAGFGLGIVREPVLTYRMPDLMVFTLRALDEDTRERDRRDPYIWKTPELIAECLSPANRKGSVEELLGDYQSIGVPEVWMFDPKQRVASIWRREQGTLREVERVTDGMLTSRQLPGAGVNVDSLWIAFERG